MDKEIKLIGNTTPISVTCTRRLHFCAGHRVFGHEGKCAQPHGHNYVALFEAHGSLDLVGRVVDFSVLKERIGAWIDANWDHGFVYCGGDVEIYNAMAHLDGVKLFGMADNPTAENMAAYLLRHVCPAVLRDTGVVVRKVTLWETENCFAEAALAE